MQYSFSYILNAYLRLLQVDGVFIFLGGNKPSVDFLMNQVEMTNLPVEGMFHTAGVVS